MMECSVLPQSILAAVLFGFHSVYLGLLLVVPDDRADDVG